jgi:hypothetical protein
MTVYCLAAAVDEVTLVCIALAIGYKTGDHSLTASFLLISSDNYSDNLGDSIHCGQERLNLSQFNATAAEFGLV